MMLTLLTAAGGIGLFLLGMAVLTDGLRALAGNTLRFWLRHSTGNRFTGVLTGIATTALVQSSSATTVATIGFVGAGLITFPQSLGIIFGANIGTTLTGWLVAVLGFKLNLATLMMPVVLVGILMRMFGRGRWKHLGWALAGFSLLFFGIAAMQSGMASLTDVVSPADFPPDSLVGRLLLVLIGVAITLVTQSSSAGVATALAALTAGAISFPQAAAMVIGMNVGTTFTAALATVGGSLASRRTGYAHVIYNVMTGIMAFGLLGPLGWLMKSGYAAGLAGDPLLSLVAFHTAFNVLGVVAVIGFTEHFARLIVWLVPERGPHLTARLDDRLLSDPHAAADAMAATIRDLSGALFAALADRLDRTAPKDIEERLAAIAAAEDATRIFARHIRTDPGQILAHRRHLAGLHALDHLQRLEERCRQSERIAALAADPALARFAADLQGEIRTLLAAEDMQVDAEDRLNLVRKRLREARHSYRERTIAAAASGEIEPADAMLRLDAIRWLHRVSYHVWRIVHHRRIAESQAPEAAAEVEGVLEETED